LDKALVTADWTFSAPELVTADWTFSAPEKAKVQIRSLEISQTDRYVAGVGSEGSVIEILAWNVL